jgi:hypothetical protein
MFSFLDATWGYLITVLLNLEKILKLNPFFSEHGNLVDQIKVAQELFGLL